MADGGEVTAGTLYASLGDLHGDGVISVDGAVLDTDLRFDATHPTQVVNDFGSGGTLTVTAGGGTLGAGYKGLGSLTVADGIAVASSDWPPRLPRGLDGRGNNHRRRLPVDQ